jgi:hypothetical protein
VLSSKGIAKAAAVLAAVALAGGVAAKVGSSSSRVPESYVPYNGALPKMTDFALPKPVALMAKAPTQVDPYGPTTVPVPADVSSMTIAILSSEVGAIPTAPAVAPAVVGEMDAASGQMVDPPTGQDKVGADWNGTTVRITASAYPSYPSYGTTYVYGHACLGAICPFSAIKQHKDGNGFTVKPQDLILVTTPTGRLTYAITRVGLAPKKKVGALPDWASDGTVPNRLVLVTCDYDDNGQSNDNIVITADLLWTKRT